MSDTRLRAITRSKDEHHVFKEPLKSSHTIWHIVLPAAMRFVHTAIIEPGIHSYEPGTLVLALRQSS